MNENRTSKPAPSHGVTHGSTQAGEAAAFIQTSDSLDCFLQGETTTTDGPATSSTVDLNPAFVEALMGLPVGWSDPLVSLTASTFSETATCHSVPPRQSGSLQLAS
jgi:hypothetical protein